MLPFAKKLEWLQLSSAGADRYFNADTLPKSVILTNAVGAYGLTVSEHMTAFTLSLMRRFPQYSRNQFNHEWKIMGDVKSVQGSTVLVIGMGDIGTAYAKQMRALGAYVIGIRRTRKPMPAVFSEQFTIDHLDEVLPRADVVAMVIPGSDATRKIMNAERFAIMKDGSYLINVGRGISVDTDALIDALKSGKLAGAALDVTDPEPLPKDSSLWTAKNLILTPHISGDMGLPYTVDLTVDIICDNLRRYARGESLTHVVDTAAGY
jgi:phosphoglycerate dehydrogenase-like enzyme